MDFFDKLGDTLVSASKEVGQKAKDMSDVAKLQYELKVKEDFLNKKYQEVGRKYYEEHKEDEEYHDCFDDIASATLAIKELRAQIMDMKGAKACPKCGAKQAVDATFCNACGAKLDDMFEEE